MPLSTLEDAPSFDHAGFTFRPLAVPSRGSRELAVWALELGPGAVSEVHTMDREEVFVVVRGSVAATVDGEDLLAGPGDAVVVHAGEVLQVRNGSAQDGATLTAATSVGMRATVDGATFSPPWAQ